MNLKIFQMINHQGNNENKKMVFGCTKKKMVFGWNVKFFVCVLK